MLFAPKAGSELRSQLSEQAGNLANTASEGYRARASARSARRAGPIAAARCTTRRSDAVSRGADEAQRYVRDARASDRRHRRARLDRTRRVRFGSSSASHSRRHRPSSGRARIAPELIADDERHRAHRRERGARLGRRGGGVRGAHDAAASAPRAARPRGSGSARACPVYLADAGAARPGWSRRTAGA